MTGVNGVANVKSYAIYGVNGGAIGIAVYAAA